MSDGIWMSKDQQSVSYPSEGNSVYFQIEENSFWFKNRNFLILETIKKFVLPYHVNNPSFLDLGGGNGYVAKAVQGLGLETHLVEPGDGVFNAKKRGIRNIYKCTIQDLPSDLSYDLIGLFDVIEHIEKPSTFLKNLSVRLNPEGQILITVPAYQFLWSRDDVMAGHFRRYTRRNLIDALEDAGYEVQFCSYFFLPLVAPIALFRTLPFLLKKMFRQSFVSVKTEKEHSASKVLSYLIDGIFSLERKIIFSLGRLTMGASIVLVARKKSIN